MAKNTITATAKIEALPAGDYVDSGSGASKGLQVRVTDGGARTWYFRYTSPTERNAAGHGVSRRVKVGTFPATSYTDARKAARKLQAEVDRGVDPAAAKAAAAAVETVAQLWDFYCETHLSGLRPKTASEIERQARVYILPAIGRVKADALTPRIVAGVWEAVERRGSKTMAKRVFATLRHFFGFLTSRLRIAVNPMAGARYSFEPKSRDRTLAPDEIGAFWRNLDTIKIDRMTRIALRLLLATGQRAGEVLGARVEELSLDGEAPVWTIPAERAKNGRTHALPLSPLAAGLFREALAIGAEKRQDSGFVFPSLSRARLGGVKINATDGTVTAHAMRRNWQALGLASPATPHDLRRTAATHMIEAGTDPLVVESVLNHVSGLRGGVAGVYNRAKLSEPMRRALDAWAREIERLAGTGEPAKVIPLRRA